MFIVLQTNVIFVSSKKKPPKLKIPFMDQTVENDNFCSKVEAMANVIGDTSLLDDPVAEILNTLSRPTDSRQIPDHQVDFPIEANHTI